MLASGRLGHAADDPQPGDDRSLYRLTDGVLLHYAALAAYRLGFFAALADGTDGVPPRDGGEGRPGVTAARLAARLGVDEAAVHAMTGAAAAFGLVRSSAGRIELTASGGAFLLPDSPSFAGPLLDFCLDLLRGPFRYDDLERALRERPASAFEAWLPAEDPPAADRDGTAARFVAAMHQHSRAAAAVWPRRVDLAAHRHLLDVGGGSGVHAIAAVGACPHLRATVLESPAVAPLTCRYVAAAGAEARVAVVAGDMWRDDLPAADVHFYSDVLHDWPIERCQELLRRSAVALPAGGRVLIHEMLLDEDRCGPPEVVASGLAMRLLNGGQQLTRSDLFELLAGAGLDDLEAVPTVGAWFLVSGRRREGRGGDG